MDKARYQAEYDLLKSKIPDNAYRLCFEDGPYLRIAAKTNSGNVYTLHMDLLAFPESQPKAFVTCMLKTRSGKNMDSASFSMHTLSSEHGWTRICFYGASSWTPNVSLYKVYIKCRLWLEMYETHLRTGKPIDYYLNHQS